MRQQQDDHDTREGEQNRGHDDARIGERLKLAGHHDVNEQNDEQTQYRKVAERVLLVLITTTQLDHHVAGLVHLVDERLGVGDDFTHGTVLDNGRNGDDALAVLTLDGGRVELLGDGTHPLEADAGTHSVIEHDVLDVADAAAVLGIIHYLDVILHTVLAEVARRRTVDAVAQGSGGGAQVQAVQRQLLAVKVHMVLGLVVTAADVDIGSTGHFLEDAFQALGHAVGLCEVVAVDLIVQRVLATHAATTATTHVNHRSLQLGVVLEVFTHHAGNLGDAALALVGLVEHDIHRDDMATVALHRGEGVVAAGLTHGVVEGLDLGILLGPFLVDALADVLGQVNARTDGQLQRDAQTAVVIGGEELSADKLHQEDGEYKHT